MEIEITQEDLQQLVNNQQSEIASLNLSINAISRVCNEKQSENEKLKQEISQLKAKKQSHKNYNKKGNK